LWSDGQTTQIALGLSTGSYSVTVTDANNCTTVANVTVGQPTELTASISKTNVQCNGDNDGTATVTPSGGTPAYTYLWNDPMAQTTQTATGLAPGTYNVQVTDANGCIVYQNITITQPSLLSVNTEFTEPSCFTSADGGTATATASGGTGQYSYLWDDSSAQTTQTASNLSEGTYTVTVTDEAGCTATASQEVTIPLQTFADAGDDQILDTADCGVTTVGLLATGEDQNGVILPGTWTIMSGSGGSFIDDTDPNTIFTGSPGVTYVLKWAIDCAEDTVQITFANGCSQLDFDGLDDNVTFRNDYNLTSGAFSIEIWVKSNGANTIGNDQTIFSKRSDDNRASGYDLSLINNYISFNWNNTGSLIASDQIDTSRWYHVAVTFNGTNEYNLYIDGILVGTNTSGDLPLNNPYECLLGAMDQSATPPFKPVNYFHGWTDELRIWDVELNVRQIRHMMNQQIIDNGNVQGEVVPLDIPGLTWADLDGYYQMNQSTPDINSGYLVANVGNKDGRLRNITTWQAETAPLPYESIRDGIWTDISASTPWRHSDTVWDIPNADGINGDPIDWNIVVVSNNITSGDKHITVLGLISDTANKVLEISDPFTTQDETNAGQGLWVTHYLKLDGIIDLMGESQLVQKRYYLDPSDPLGIQSSESILATSSAGYLERDQQGTNNPFNYNYWGSPVGPIGAGSNNNPRNLNGTLRDGTNSNNPQNLNWTPQRTPPANTNPITLSTRWTYTYENFTQNTYAAWQRISSSIDFAAGLGYIMKGSNNNFTQDVQDTQNYVFLGKPNNGDISNLINVGNESLAGNPYPSAIDSHEFIKDNIPLLNPDGSPTPANADTSGSIDGSLYFWEHYPENDTHITRDYQGGYAICNLLDCTARLVPPDIAGGTATKTPGQYIPIGQGWFVTASELGGQVTFHNDQRVFIREDTSNSVFLRSNNMKESNTSPPPPKAVGDEHLIKRLRLEFKNPEGAIRELLLGFVPNNKATDGFDYGYDALNYDNTPNDMFWLIDNDKYVMQGVGDFNETKQYPLGLFLSTGGNIEIKLSSLENFNPNTKVYIYDMLLGTYTKINNKKYEANLDIGDYVNRFYLTFINDSTLSIEEEEEVPTEINSIIVNYLNDTDEIYIKTPHTIDVKQIYLINMIGQSVRSWNITNLPVMSHEMNIRVKNISDGNYIIKVETSTGVINKKIIIKH
jgi:hypothetical protein